MSSKPKVLMIVTLDTKAVEAQFIRQTLEAEGVDVIHLDASIRDPTDPNVEIAPEAVAAAAGKTIQEVRDLRHEGKCQAVMIEAPSSARWRPRRSMALPASSVWADRWAPRSAAS